MSLIIEDYKDFPPDVSGKQVHDSDDSEPECQWTSIKRLIVNFKLKTRRPLLMLMPLRQLWVRMLGMFAAQFPLILRASVLAIAMTFATTQADTSGCERLKPEADSV